MTRIIMHGCNGAMGQVISDIVRKDETSEIVAGIDIVDNKENGYPVFTSFDDCNVEADVIIDFASPKATDKLLEYCETTKTPAELCTTGLSQEQIEKIKETCDFQIRKYVTWYHNFKQISSDSSESINRS